MAARVAKVLFVVLRALRFVVSPEGAILFRVGRCYAGVGVSPTPSCWGAGVC